MDARQISPYDRLLAKQIPTTPDDDTVFGEGTAMSQLPDGTVVRTEDLKVPYDPTPSAH